uniref:Ig-like domain-containing protein n=1 Tax=Fundulus heteroclitus TaxID=8078 RepID=A0A3Q2QXM8_FUNHE
MDLTQPASMTVQPGQSLTISCQVSSVSSYTHWIRQPAGKGLEWIGAVAHGSTTYYKDSLRNKFSLSAVSSSNTVTLNGQTMQPGDSAVYYCACLSHYVSPVIELSGSPFPLWFLTLLHLSAPCRYSVLSPDSQLMLCVQPSLCSKRSFVSNIKSLNSQFYPQSPPASLTVQPGQALSINCQVSYSVTSYGTHWIRHPAGKALEYMGVLWGDGSNRHANSVQGRIGITRDTSKNIVNLRLSTMRPEDSAVYYCARLALCGNYWQQLELIWAN